MRASESVVARTESLLLAVLLHASMNTTLGTLDLLDGASRLRALVVAVTAVVVVFVGLFIVARRSQWSG